MGFWDTMTGGSSEHSAPKPKEAPGTYNLQPAVPFEAPAQKSIDMQATAADYAPGSRQQFLQPQQTQQPAMVPVTESQTSVQQKTVPPEVLRDMNLAQSQQKAAIADSLKAESEQNALRAQAWEIQNKAVKEREAQLDGLMMEFQNAQVVDPQSQWGTARKIGAAIAMGLGAYASAFTGGQNHAANIIQDSIKRDIEMQEARINKLGLNAKNAQGALAQATAKLGNIADAKSAVEIAALMNANESIMKLAQATDNKRSKANADSLIAANNMKITEKKAELQASTVTSSVAKSQRPLAGSGEMARQEKEANEAMEYENAKQTIMQAFEEGAKAGMGGAVPSWLGGEAGEREASLAQVSGAIIGKVPGIKSDADFKNIVLPMLPKPIDPKSTVESKRKNLEAFLRSQAPAAWLKTEGRNKTAQEQTDQSLGFQPR